MWLNSFILIIIWYCSYYVDAWISCSTTIRSVGFRSIHNCNERIQQNLAFLTQHIQQEHQDASTNSRHQYEGRYIIKSNLLLSLSNEDIDDSELGIRVTADKNEYTEYGNAAILRAASSCGITDPNDINIQWKTSKIIVCIQRNDIIVSSTEEDDYDIDDEDDLYDENENDNDNDVDDDDVDDDDDDDDIDDFSINDDEGSENQLNNDDASNSSDMKIDLVKIARMINEVLDDGDIGALIAEKYEIEVTTPGASNEIIGSIMFRAYRGFDVTVTLLSSQQQQEEDDKKNIVNKKKKEEKNIFEGRLVERNEENTIINIKGRMKTIPNDKILSVTLPKAKKE